jgi:peptidyl-tRNA hydrolase, PTH1 family
VALRRTRENDRRGQKSTLLIVGLANPGNEYEGSRHNVGGDAVRLVVERMGGRFSHERRQRAESVTLTTPRGPVTFAIPTTFMNDSGAAVAPLLRRTSITDLSELVVVHDELDLEPGRLQLRLGGGLAGHNGLRSIAKSLNSQEFARLRIGIGKPPTKEQGADYVLRRSTGKHREAMEADVVRATDAIETLLAYDFEEARQRINAS